MNAHLKELALELYRVQCIQFGSFTLKDGSISPIYLDLRLLISYPSLMKMITQALWELSNSSHFDIVCGVPDAAIPLASCFSVQHNTPMIFKRTQPKKYGTQKIIEGVYQAGQTCLILEDVITSGLSIIEMVNVLRKESIVITDCIAVVTREQGGKKHLKQAGIDLHCLFKVSDLLMILEKHQKISAQRVSEVTLFLEQHQL